jgi:DinB superfamily
MGTLGEMTGGILRLPRIFTASPLAARIAPVASGQLEIVRQQAEAISLRAKELIAGRSEAELAISLEHTSWSVAQCFDHLAQTTNAFVPSISSAIARAPRLTSDRTLKTGALTRLFLRNLEPPYRLRFKVLAPLVPRQRNFHSSWAAFLDSQVQLAKMIRSAAGLAVDQVKIESPVYARFSYNVYGALRMLTAHQRRHLWQIEQILKTLDGAKVRNAS